MDKGKAIGGWFLTLSEEEEGDVRDLLTDAGYPGDVSGLKRMLLDGAFEAEDNKPEEPPSRADIIIEKAAAYLKENPDKIRMAASLLGNLIKRKARH